ncbi:MAG: DUF882 domain-containing protein [Alphaproteobacteria bacterium]|nr:DUF882 domain-containing protein [Alphaproteobacteria bacterium]
MSVFALGLALSFWMGADSSTAGRDNERRIALYNIHNKETLDIVYMRNGKRIPSAMKKINWILRDWRQNEATKMDPRLIDLLWEIRTELGTREPTHIISGYRSPKTNRMLRKTRGGQAKKSRHILGKAMDIHFPDVPVKRLRYSALIRERGGVGYYPTSAIPFVHIDTGRTRHWPRMPRYELALLFPNGKTRHVPSDGRRISKKDVRTARARHKKLAGQLASFHAFRSQPVAPKPTLVAGGWDTRVFTKRPKLPPVETKPAPRKFQVASLTPLVPPAPRPIARPARLMSKAERATPPGRTPLGKPMAAKTSKPAPTSKDRSQLADLFALASLGGSFFSRPARPAAKAARLPDDRPTQQGLAATDQANATTASQGSTESRLGLDRQQLVTANRPSDEANRPISEAEMAGWSNGFIAAPAYDEEHPDELFYRPFPLAPMLTSSASADDPALARMQHPDVAATLDLLGEESVTLPMRFTARQQLAELMWTQQFTGKAILSPLESARVPGAVADNSGLSSRSVQTSIR